MLGADAIKLGYRDVVLAAGMESMSQVPYILRGARQGFGYGHQTVEVIGLNGFRRVFSLTFRNRMPSWPTD